MPSDAVRDEARDPRAARPPSERHLLDAMRVEKDAGQRPRGGINPVLGLKAEIHDLRIRLKTSTEESEEARHQQDLRLREVEAFALSLEAKLADRDRRLAALHDSFCWRVTRPLRVARRLQGLAAGLLKQAASRLYRAAPLPGAIKRLILDILFQTAPRVFRDSNTYRAWAVQRGARVPHEVAFPAEAAVSLAVPFEFSAPVACPRLAVLCHVYHEHIAPEIAGYLANIPFPYALYVTTDDQAKIPAITAAFGGALTAVRVVPNRGRDIAAKLLGFPEAYRRHEFVLHIHAKLSAHTDTLETWRGFLLENLLGSASIVESVFTIFAARPEVGMIAAQHFEPLRHWINWGGNFAAAQALGRRMGATLSETAVLDFPAGSMFWARAAAIKPLLDMGLTFDSFEAEGAQVDGTLAHAVERLFFHACEQAGLDWVRIAHPPLFAATPAIVRLEGPGDLARFAPQRMRGSRVAPRRAAGAPLPPAPTLIARLQDRALGHGQRVDAAAVVVGITGSDSRRAAAGASRALGQAGIDGRVAIRAAGFAAGHNRLMAEAFADGADVYIAAAADGVFHPDAIANLVRMALAHDGRALIEAAVFPAAHPKGFSAITLETPWTTDGCLAITRRLYDRLGGFDESLPGPCAAIDYSWRARINGLTVRCCPTALFLRPAVLKSRAPLEATLGAGLILARKWGNAEVENRLKESLRALGATTPEAPPAPAPPVRRDVADFSGLADHMWAQAWR